MGKPPPHYRRNRKDRERLAELIACKVPLARIAERFGISVDTLRRHYSVEIADAGLTRGPDAYEPTDQDRRTVQTMIASGAKQTDVATVLGICDRTLREHYREQIDLASVKANALVGQGLLRTATDWMKQPDGKPTKESTQAAIWWSKVRMGWIETRRDEITGKDGGAIDVRDLGTEQLIELLGRLQDEEAKG